MSPRRNIARRAARAGAVALAGLVLAVPGTANAVTCPSGLTPTNVLLSTGSANGTADPFGAADVRWQIDQVVGGQVTPAPVFSVNKIADYVEPRPIGNWISPSPTGLGTGGGSHYYTVRFFVPAGATVDSLVLHYAADDGVTLSLNGTPIGGYVVNPPNIYDHSAFAQWHHVIYKTQATFVPGLNTLDAVVDNVIGSYGFTALGGVNLCT